MSDGHFTRRLAAVLSADMVGYTRLMSADEEGTHGAYTAHLNEVFQPRIRRHRGRIVKSTGDGFIAEFESIVEGVECAVEMQAEISSRNAAAPAGKRIEYRMGVNLGDIIVERDDIYGDGVNIAARLQGIAPPGGVCVSQTVYEQMRSRSSMRFDDLGRRRVKNIADPVRVYGVAARAAEPRRRPAWLHSRANKAIAAAVAAAVVIVAAAALLWREDRLLVQDEQTSQSATLPAVPSDRPSVAVLAFRNLGNDQDQTYFAEGIADDITTDLSKLSDLFVISRDSSFFYKDSGKDPVTIARELGVRYVLQGSVRRSGDLVRINAQLIDAQTGLHVWAARHDSRLQEVFAVQDKISREVVSALSVRIKDGETEPRTLVGTDNVAAYDAYLQGWALYRRLDSTNHDQAVAHFERAIALDPDYAQAHAALAATYLAIRNNAWTLPELQKRYFDPVQSAISAERHSTEMVDMAREHLSHALDKPIPLATRVAAELFIQERKYDDAMQHVVSAIALDPNDADSYAQLASVLIWTGKASEALEPLQKAMRLNPHFPDDYLAILGIAHFVLRDYERAQELLENTAVRNPRSQLTLVHLLSTYGHLGNEADAERVLKQMNSLRSELGYPPFTVGEARRVIPYRVGVDQLHLLVGLHKAGVPDFLTDPVHPDGRRPMGSNPPADAPGVARQ